MKAIALGQGRGLREGAGQRHRTSIGDRRHVAVANSIAAIVQRRVDGAALGDADAVAERVALIRLRRLGEAAGGVADRAGIGDRRHVAVADSIGAIAQHRIDSAAAVNDQAIGKAIALGRGRGLREGASQRYRTTTIAVAGGIAVGDGIAIIAQRRNDGAALGDADAVAERGALIRLRRLAEASAGERPCIGVRAGCSSRGGLSVVRQRHIEVPRIGETLTVVERDGLKDSTYLREIVSARNRPNGG